jgi:hypothetical protein
VRIEHPVPPRPDARRRLSRSAWLTLGPATAVALVAIAVFPRSGGDAPPLASLALIGAVVTGVTTAALSLLLRRALGLPVRVVASFAIAFVLIGVVKFVLAPFGLYEVNAVRAIEAVAGTVTDPIGATITAAAVFGLYALGYWLAFRVGAGGDIPLRRVDRRRSRSRPSAAVLIVGALIAIFALSFVGLIALLLLNAPRQYLDFVFSSGAGLLVTAALLVAAILIGSVFRRLERGDVVELGTLLTLFWLGLGFLALFHVLWIVYVITLGSIWPLKTVVPK